MLSHIDLMARMAVAEGRMAAFADNPPQGLTTPDADTGEQWDAGQAWAHVAEFVPYWQGELQRVVAGGGGTPVPFGRQVTDPSRVGAIETNRHEPPTAQMTRLAGALTLMRTYLVGLTDAQWAARGIHPRLGEMTTAQIVERFVVGHLEEHADQLQELATRSSS